MSAPRVIAAVGSSFAAGPGLPPYEDPAAMRSRRNYAHQLAELTGARLTDLTVSGATTANVLDTPQQLMSGASYAPQLDGLPADADVVTITAGGNDLQYAGALLFVALQRREPASPILPMLTPLFGKGIPEADSAAIEAATTGLVRVVERAKQLAPAALIVLVDYLTVLDTASQPATPFTPDEIAKFLDIQAAIGRVFAGAAEQTGVELVLASQLSAGHALGSPEPWVQPFYPDLHDTPGSFHPAEAGMAAIAAELAKLVNI